MAGGLGRQGTDLEVEKKKMTELTYGHPPLALTEKLYFSLFLSGFHESYNLKKD